MSVDPTKVSALVQALKDVFENKQTNKKDDISGDFSSDSISYPTVKGVKSFFGTKVKSWSSTTSDDNYPSEKLVKDSLDAKASSTHTHGNITNDGKVGSNANYIIVTTTGGAITSVQKLGNITYDGKIGSTSGLPIITTTSGKLTTGSFGSTSGTFAEGNHTHSGYTSSSDVDSQIDAALDAITTALSS